MRTDLPLRAEGVHDVGHPIEVLTTVPAAAPAVHVEHAPQTQAFLAAVLADVLQVEQVPVDAHVFDDLGADSMVMARFCARVCKQPDLPTVSMKDVYQHPTIHSLAAAVTADVPATAKQSAPGPTAAPPPPAPAGPPPGGGRPRRRACHCQAVGPGADRGTLTCPRRHGLLPPLRDPAS